MPTLNAAIHEMAAKQCVYEVQWGPMLLIAGDSKQQTIIHVIDHTLVEPGEMWIAQ